MRRAPILDGRLSTAMELAKGSRIFADIGADHGRLSTVMLLEDPQRIGLVADISPLALDKARARIERMGLNARAHLRVADGLEALRDFPYHPDTVFILGMGGDTVSQILLRGSALLHDAALVLGAQTEIPLVREALAQIGYRISNEIIANENKRDYLLIRAERSGNPVSYSEKEILLGPVLLKTLPQNWLPVLKRRERLLQQGIIAMENSRLEKDSARLEAAKREIQYVSQTIDQIHGGKTE